MDSPRNRKLVLYPSPGSVRVQQEEIALALERVWQHGGWTVYIDELFYVTKMLGLGLMVERLLTQGRSKGISVVCGMQRPTGITRYAISESTHVVSFFLEGRDRKVLGEAGASIVADAGETLGKYEFAWFYRPERASGQPERMLWTGKLQDLTDDGRMAV